jgi:hypothetical protein
MPQKDNVPEANISSKLLDGLVTVNALDIAIGLCREKDPFAPFERNSVQTKIAILNPYMVRQRIALFVHNIRQDRNHLVASSHANAAKIGAVRMTGKCTAEISHNSVLFCCDRDCGGFKGKGFPPYDYRFRFWFRDKTGQKEGGLFCPLEEPACRILLN